jgi:hypothetical protein
MSTALQSPSAIILSADNQMPYLRNAMPLRARVRVMLSVSRNQIAFACARVRDPPPTHFRRASGGKYQYTPTQPCICGKNSLKKIFVATFPRWV